MRCVHAMLCAACFVLVAVSVFSGRSYAHGIVGDRMFIEPLFTEDANIKNELVFPRSEFLQMPDGSFRVCTISLEKELWPERWSVIVEQGVLSLRRTPKRKTGFDNLEVGTKFAAYRDERHEFVISPLITVALPTGSAKVTERKTALRPAVAWAKGFGDLRPQWLRPVALQGDFAVETSATGERERRIGYDMVLQYSIPYLNHFVRSADAGYELEHTLRRGTSPRAILGDVFPFVEFNGETPVGGTAGHTNTVLRPGLLYMGKYIQTTFAADITLRSESTTVRNGRAGAVIQLDFFLDEFNSRFGRTPFGRHAH